MKAYNHWNESSNPMNNIRRLTHTHTHTNMIIWFKNCFIYSHRHQQHVSLACLGQSRIVPFSPYAMRQDKFKGMGANGALRRVSRRRKKRKRNMRMAKGYGQEHGATAKDYGNGGVSYYLRTFERHSCICVRHYELMEIFCCKCTRGYRDYLKQFTPTMLMVMEWWRWRQ